MLELSQVYGYTIKRFYFLLGIDLGALKNQIGIIQEPQEMLLAL